MRDEERKELARRALSGDAEALLEFVDRTVEEAVERALQARGEAEPRQADPTRRGAERVREHEVLEVLRGSRTRRHFQVPIPSPVSSPPGPPTFTYTTDTANLRSCPICGASPPCSQDCR